MQKRTVLAGATLLALLAAPVRSEEAGKPAARPSGKAEETTTISALVQQVDVAKREVTLRKVDGTVFTISVGPDVKNLSAVKKDDLVVAKLTQTLSWQVAAPGQPSRPVVETASGDLGKAGEKPAGVQKKVTTGTLTVAAVDRKASTLTVRERQGATKVLAVRDPKTFDLLKVGDVVDVTFQETMAVAVEPAPKK